MASVTVRAVHDHEWRETRDLRLRSLQDEVAAIAFVDNFESASAKPDEFWQERAAGSSLEAGTDAPARQFAAVTEDGTWVGSLTVLIEQAGDKDFEGAVVERSAGAVVGVYLDPAFRGAGIIQTMLDMAVEWLQLRGLDHARLYVHADNLRAQRAYEKSGFHPTGKTLLGSVGEEIEMARDV